MFRVTSLVTDPWQGFFDLGLVVGTSVSAAIWVTDPWQGFFDLGPTLVQVGKGFSHCVTDPWQGFFDLGQSRS